MQSKINRNDDLDSNKKINCTVVYTFQFLILKILKCKIFKLKIFKSKISKFLNIGTNFI